ncbi:MAG: histidine kinase [Clostridia bacterium]|nr:histidine kinase [Clostridia bacterium]
MGISVIDNHINGINFANEFCCAIFTAVILGALLVKKHHNNEIRALIYFCFCSASAMWTDAICYMCGGNTRLVGVLYAMTAVSYAFTAFSACTFLIYILTYFEERKGVKYSKANKACAYIYSVICSLIYASSIWTGRYFYIDSTGRYQATSRAAFTGAILFPLAAISIIVIIANRKLTSKRDTIIHLFYSLSFIILGIFDSIYTLSFHYIVMTVFVFCIFIFINQERDKELQIKEKELAISELNALRLQMNPHFVYNTLASIDGLIVVEPDEARQLIAKFTKHLRSSYLDNSPALVPFEKELENIKCYLSVEQVRFPDINVEYNLNAMDFDVPPLTVQPIVENAIKHGICKRDDGAGTITISTFDDDNNYYIEIKDNGVGFDVNSPEKDDGKKHIGIVNTQKRLELICKGELKITSEIDVGTKSVITIPKENI